MCSQFGFEDIFIDLHLRSLRLLCSGLVRRDSNPQHTVLETVVLPIGTTHQQYLPHLVRHISGGPPRTRTQIERIWNPSCCHYTNDPLNGAPGGNRTPEHLVCSERHYHSDTGALKFQQRARDGVSQSYGLKITVIASVGVFWWWAGGSNSLHSAL